MSGKLASTENSAKSRKIMESQEDFFDDSADADLLAAVEGPSRPMTDAQRSRAEKNRMKAIALKKARISAKPYPDPKAENVIGEKLNAGRKEKQLVDTKAGFFIEEDDTDNFQGNVEPLPAPVIEPDRPHCLECQVEIADSYLFRSFDHEVCDKCKETEKDGKHELITKTDAKNEFLMKDPDFDRRPALKFILRKNPHNPRWGEMKLFLRSQVEQRALEIWGDEESLQQAHETREDRREQAKAKKFNKKLKALRMQVRGSLYKKDISVHQHEYGEEVYDEEEDQYSKTCTTCGHVNSYEKM